MHPFADGDGRVMRLFTDAWLKAIGMESVGVWSLSRGLARASTSNPNSGAVTRAGIWVRSRQVLTEVAVVLATGDRQFYFTRVIIIY